MSLPVSSSVNAEALDTLRATATASEQYYVFAPAQLAPRSIFGLSVRISKTATAPVVTDSSPGARHDGPCELEPLVVPWCC